MTIVIYRDKTLAADTLITHGDTVWAYAKKIIKAPDGSLAGAAGNLSFVQEFLDWASRVDREEYDPPKSSHTNQALLITKKTVLYYTGPRPIVMTAKYIAIGCGTDIAYGALWMGASADQAVNAAIAHNGKCGGTIDHVIL